MSPAMLHRLDYDPNVREVSRMLLLPATLGLLPLPGCIEDVDLRDPALLGDRGGDQAPGDTACSAGERIDPNTGACAPCTDVDPLTVCPCDYDEAPAPFPACAGPAGQFSCAPTCTGDVTHCNAYREIDGIGRVRDCDQLRACCDLLATGGATPCCPSDEILFCFAGSGTGAWRFGFLCLSSACCAVACISDLECDRAFQTCKDHRCVPGCDVASEYCHSDGSGCACRPL